MVNVGDVFKFSLEQEMFAQQVINTFALKVTAVPGGTDETAFQASLFANAAGWFNQAGNLRAVMIAAQSPAVVHKKWISQRVTPLPTLALDWTLTTAVVGTAGAAALTANLAMAISRKGSAAGRRNKGRIALAGLTEDALANGVWDAGKVADGNLVGSRMIGVQTPAAGTSFEMGWWSPTHTGMVHHLPVIYPAQFVKAVAATARNTARVQRSRTIGVGR